MDMRRGDANDELWARIDAKCDEFERARQNDESVSITDYTVADWPSGPYSLLLGELIDLELEFLSREGKSIDPTRYFVQFPQHKDVVQGCLLRHNSQERNSTNPELEITRQFPRPFSSGLKDKTLGPYELIEEIARGGMGVVYRARDRRLNRDVALKVVLAGELASPEALERFRLEARAAAQLDHPMIVPVFDVGTDNERPYIAMGLIEGRDLTTAVTDNLYSPSDAADLLLKLAETLQYAHDQGILHRDLKPANVLLDARGEPRVTDFGLAKELNQDLSSHLTQTGQVLGTPSYMSPEQASGKSDIIEPTTDVYALGAILYFVLTGRPPFRAAGMAETLRQVLQDDPVSPRAINPQVDRNLETICLTCLAKEPQRRFATCQALADDLRRYLAGEPIRARPVGSLARAIHWCKRHPTRAALLASTLLLLISLVTAFEYRRAMESATDRLEGAEQLAASRQKTADTANFFRLMQEAEALKTEHEPGWTWKVEQLLERATALPREVQDDLLLREAVVNYQTSYDLRKHRVVAPNILPGSMAFSPDGQYFAVGQLVDAALPTVLVYDRENLNESKWTFSFNSTMDTVTRTLRGKKRVHNGIRSLAFSPDNRWLAAGTRFGQVLVYDLMHPSTAPRRLEVLADQEVGKVAFSHDGNLLYAMVRRKLLREWTSFERPVDLEGDLTDFAVDPKGRRIVVAADSVEIRTDLSSPVDLTVGMEWEVGQDCYLAISPDGHRLAIANDQSLIICELHLTRPSGRLISSGFESIALFPIAYEGRLVLTTSREWLHVWDVLTSESLYRISTDMRVASHVALDPRGEYLAVGSQDVAQLFQLRIPRSHRCLTAPVETLSRATFDGSNLVINTEGPGRACLTEWDCVTGNISRKRVLLDSAHLLANLEGSVAARKGTKVSKSRGVGLVAWHPSTKGQPVEVLTHLGHSRSLGLNCIQFESNLEAAETVQTPDGSSVLRIQSAETGTWLRIRLPLDDLPEHWHHLAVCAVVRLHLAAHEGPGFASGYLRKPAAGKSISDLAERRPLLAHDFAGSDLALVIIERSSRENFAKELDALIHLAEAPHAVESIEIHDVVVFPMQSRSDGTTSEETQFSLPEISPDERKVWAVQDEEFVCSWPLNATGRMTRWSVSPELENIYDLQVGRRWVYTAARNGHVQLTDPDTGELKHQLELSTSPLTNVGFGPDETWIIVSGDAGTVEMREIPSGKLVREIVELDRAVTAQALSESGRWLALGDSNGRCSLWRRNGESYEELFQLARLSNAVHDLTFSEDGRYLAVTGKGIHLFDLHELNRVCEQFGAGFITSD